MSASARPRLGGEAGLWVHAAQPGRPRGPSAREAALSPQRQLALLALLVDAVAEGGQFLIASHAPIVISSW